MKTEVEGMKFKERKKIHATQKNASRFNMVAFGIFSFNYFNSFISFFNFIEFVDIALYYIRLAYTF